MKIRNGFVSNSSSSSFVVFSMTGIYEIPQMPKLLKDRSTLLVPFIFGGETEFGRERQDYTDFGSRLNWAYIQAKNVYDVFYSDAKGFHKDFLTKERKEFLKQHKNDISKIEKVLKDNINGIEKIEWRLVDYHEKEEIRENYKGKPQDEYEYMEHFKEAYIDHGSMWYERPERYEAIFESEDSLFEWLFGKGNYIANRSDEYEDESSLTVDHTCDYKYDIDGLYYDPYNDKEMFDEDGNFLG